MNCNLPPLALIGGAVFVSYFAGRLTRLIRLPSIIGYMLCGVLLGPSVLDLLNEAFVDEVAFITQIALGFVAFSIGSELNLATLKRHGRGLVAVILCESFAAFGLVTLAVYLFTGDLPLSLVFGAMAPASAPAGTVAVIQEYRAKGPLTEALYAVVGFDDGLAIVIFGFASAIASSLLCREAGLSADSGVIECVLTPGREILFSILMGGAIGFVFSFVVRLLGSESDILILLFSVVLVASGLSEHWHLSLILTNMVIGFLFVNTRHDSLVRKVARPLQGVMPLLFVLFFCLAGAHLKVGALKSLGLLGVVYIIARSTGLISGAWLGAAIGKAGENIRKYLGLGILSQAGVAIGLALMVKHDFAEIGSKHALSIGVKVLTTITATCIFFEIIGPVLTRFGLSRAGEIHLNSN